MVKIMKSNYTLRELTELREIVKDEIAEILLDKCDVDKWYTASELEQMVGGLGSTYHFASTFAQNYTNYTTEHHHLRFRSREADRVKKCAYLNDEGEIIGTFEIHDKSVLEYQLLHK